MSQFSIGISQIINDIKMIAGRCLKSFNINTAAGTRFRIPAALPLELLSFVFTPCDNGLMYSGSPVSKPYT